MISKFFQTHKVLPVTLFVFFIAVSQCILCNHQVRDQAGQIVLGDRIWFEYEEITGIGYEEGVSRRDPSDIIRVGDLYYVWYTRIPAEACLYPSGYCGTIWYATSVDGYAWVEKGEALGPGAKGTFDSHAVFTPGILTYNGKYYLYYTGVKPTPGNPENLFENNSETDVTAIGVAVSDSPDGPFRRFTKPVIEVSDQVDDFDSYRADDACLLVREGKFWLYYKGRSRSYEAAGASHTKMGVAFADKPEGPYRKHAEYLAEGHHEILIWHQDEGIASLARLNRTIYYAEDGLNFSPVRENLRQVPLAPGLYRPHLTDHSRKNLPGWGLSHRNSGGHVYLTRFEFKSGK